MASRRTYRRHWAAVAVSAALALGGLAAPSHADEPAAGDSRPDRPHSAEARPVQDGPRPAGVRTVPQVGTRAGADGSAPDAPRPDQHHQRTPRRLRPDGDPRPQRHPVPHRSRSRDAHLRRHPAPLPRRQGAHSRTSSRAAASARASGTPHSTRSSERTAASTPSTPSSPRRPPRLPTTGRPARSPTTASSPSGPPTTRPRPSSTAPIARCCVSASPARSTAFSRSTSTRRPSLTTRTTASSTSRSATAGRASATASRRT